MKRTQRVVHLFIVLAGLFLLLVGCQKTSSQQASSSTSNVKQELLDHKTLTVGLEGTYAPFSYRKNGELAGFEVDLSRDIAKKLGVKVKFVPTKWDSLIAGLGANKFDVVLNNITKTPEREKVYDFSTPYIYSRYALITPTAKASTITKLADIKGKTVVEGTGTSNEVLAKKLGAAKILPSGDFATTLGLLRQNRADATINSTAAWYSFAKSNSTKGLKFRAVPDSQQKPDEVSALLTKKTPKLRKAINQVIHDLRADGTLKKLSEKYFGGDVTTK
ncbi:MULTISPECIES: transporter substrate-binding domain-containing protein [Lacticaseibacillus]|uniref:Amino acid ABC transporter substrate-binding protein n=2 Tax=Lacticaseibacillus TaxID=2759736 RepID=A0AAN1KFG3_LACCA|nr:MULTISPECIES: transporter substrate-binding domain-containing protein [Lacticaseibacillus]ARY92737.1 amino acid ABC transporter substrate-binding protein [Lacticaseibacillus casei]KAB1969422.1 transporter substrate-binding domain-containing protein [Lacticaseibacillus casei]WLV80638.1 transporter substrate-binding domain-containing protein [Lacticaseibacillus sp. NCIMB 15473]WNX24598.1 transporter substrate-binding domain-containing protein [Lacticaseibacillus casei]WNX27370.1 transporter s